MKKPCNQCPFLRKQAGMIDRSRVEDLNEALLHDGSFHCHKTVDYSGGEGGKITQDSRMCFGAALFLEHVAPGGCRANLMFRIALMTHEFTIEDLRLDPEVFDSVEAFYP